MESSTPEWNLVLLVAGDLGGGSASLEEAPRTLTSRRMGNNAKFQIGACGSRVHFPATELGVDTCRRPVLLPVPAMLLHAPSMVVDLELTSPRRSSPGIFSLPTQRNCPVVQYTETNLEKRKKRKCLERNHSMNIIEILLQQKKTIRHESIALLKQIIEILQLCK